MKCLEETRERMGKDYDSSRKEAHPYSVGDLVMLNVKNIRTRRAAKETGRQTDWSVQACQASGRRETVGGVGIATTLEGT